MFIRVCIQISRGVILTFFYETETRFFTLTIIRVNVRFGFLLNYLHITGASLFFLSLYLHIMKGLFLSSIAQSKIWLRGISLFLLRIAVAFLGYTLPQSNIRYWARIVITSFVRAIPLVGKTLLEWVWRGVRVNSQTIKLFFSIHYLCSFLLLVLILTHFTLLHQKGASSKLSIVNYNTPLSFRLFIVKDILNLLVIISILIICTLIPILFTESDIYEETDLLSSPKHITPEFYFLFLYTILRRISDKLWGLILLILGLVLIGILFLRFKLSWTKKVLRVLYVINILQLSYLGTKSATGFWVLWIKLHTLLYFLLNLLLLI